MSNTQFSRGSGSYRLTTVLLVFFIILIPIAPVFAQVVPNSDISTAPLPIDRQDNQPVSLVAPSSDVKATSSDTSTPSDQITTPPASDGTTINPTDNGSGAQSDTMLIGGGTVPQPPVAATTIKQQLPQSEASSGGSNI